MQKTRLVRIGIAILWGFATPALATRNVSSPVVNPGEWKAEWRAGLEFDGDSAARDHRFGQTSLVEYGVNDGYAVRLITRWSKPEHDANDWRDIGIENRFQLFEKDTDGWDGALRLSYIHADNPGTADEWGLDALGEWGFHGWKLRSNLLFGQVVGADASGGVTFDTSWQATHPINEQWDAGLEGFHDIGELRAPGSFREQSHSIGPVVSYKLSKRVNLEGGYQQGISEDASDGLLKFFVKATF